MQELKITDGKLYHHHEGVWNPISVESTPHYYGYHERDLTQGGKISIMYRSLIGTPLGTSLWTFIWGSIVILPET